jgi:hypothetical protein
MVPDPAGTVCSIKEKIKSAPDIVALVPIK